MSCENGCPQVGDLVKFLNSSGEARYRKVLFQVGSDEMLVFGLSVASKNKRSEKSLNRYFVTLTVQELFEKGYSWL